MPAISIDSLKLEHLYVKQPVGNFWKSTTLGSSLFLESAIVRQVAVVWLVHYRAGCGGRKQLILDLPRGGRTAIPRVQMTGKGFGTIGSDRHP